MIQEVLVSPLGGLLEVFEVYLVVRVGMLSNGIPMGYAVNNMNSRRVSLHQSISCMCLCLYLLISCAHPLFFKTDPAESGAYFRFGTAFPIF